MNPFIKDYGGEIDWNIGSLFCHEAPVFRLLRICDAYNIDHPIRYAFGSIPSVMAGGRIPPTAIPADDAVGVVEQYLEHGIACRLTLSNPHVTEADIRNDAVNAGLMEFLNAHASGKGRNGVIVVSDLLARHVRDRYPNLEVILSVVRPAYETGYGPDRDTFDYYARHLEDPLYDVVVVNAAKADIPGFMEDLPNKDKVELLAFHTCVKNCPRAKAHYEACLQIALAGLRGDNPAKDLDKLGRISLDCVAEKRRRPLDFASYTEADMRRLVSLGYRHFKLAERLSPDNAFLYGMVEYIFRSEPIRYLMQAMF
jgi:hypothetical protein